MQVRKLYLSIQLGFQLSSSKRQAQKLGAQPASCRRRLVATHESKRLVRVFYSVFVHINISQTRHVRTVIPTRLAWRYVTVSVRMEDAAGSRRDRVCPHSSHQRASGISEYRDSLWSEIYMRLGHPFR